MSPVKLRKWHIRLFNMRAKIMFIVWPKIFYFCNWNLLYLKFMNWPKHYFWYFAIKTIHKGSFSYICLHVWGIFHNFLNVILLLDFSKLVVMNSHKNTCFGGVAHDCLKYLCTFSGHPVLVATFRPTNKFGYVSICQMN